MIGSDSRNENRAAASLVSPTARPAVIVIPDRDTPGWRARAWATPTVSAERMVSPRIRFVCGALRSTRYRTTANTASITAISHGCPSLSSIVLSNAAPTTRPGIVPITRYQARRSSVCRMLRREIERTSALT